MKNHESPLPWNIVLKDKDRYTVSNAEGYIISEISNFDYDWAFSIKDVEYIVQAANMFPEAIRLIRMSEVYLKFLKKEDSLEYQQLKHFLTKLEEDE